MSNLLRGLRSFASDESGATAIEYGLMVALISITIVGSVSSFSSTVKTMLYDKIIAALP